MRLSDLSIGKTAKITSINFATNKIKRLEELGVVANARIKVVRFSPLKDLMLIKLRNFYLALRIADAVNIMVSEYE